MATDIDFSKENEKPCRLPFYSERGGAAEILSVNEFRRATSRKNLVLREEALADARRAWLPARDEGCPFFSVARSTAYRKEILIQKAESFPHGGNVWKCVDERTVSPSK